MDRVAEGAAESYEIVLPPGWKQHPVRRGIAEELYAHVRQVLEPTGNRELMAQLRGAIHKSMRDLQERGGIDIFLPERRPDGTLVPASLTSNVVSLGDRGLETALRAITRGKEPDAVEVPVGDAHQRHGRPGRYRDEQRALPVRGAGGEEAGRADVHLQHPALGRRPRRVSRDPDSHLRRDDAVAELEVA